MPSRSRRRNVLTPPPASRSANAAVPADGTLVAPAAYRRPRGRVALATLALAWLGLVSMGCSPPPTAKKDGTAERSEGKGNGKGKKGKKGKKDKKGKKGKGKKEAHGSGDGTLAAADLDGIAPDSPAARLMQGQRLFDGGARKDQVKLPEPAKSTGETLASSKGMFGKVEVRQSGDVRELVFVESNDKPLVQTRMSTSTPAKPVEPYVQAQLGAVLFRPGAASFLVVGSGGGALPSALHYFIPHATVDTVELDPAVVELAKQWFGLADREGLHTHTGDGAAWLSASPAKFDAIYLDAFSLRAEKSTDSDGVPKAHKTAEFLTSVRDRLSPGGIAVFNAHYVSTYPDYLAAISAVFPHVRVIHPEKYAQRIIVASQEPLGTRAAIEMRAKKLAKRKLMSAAIGGAASWIEDGPADAGKGSVGEPGAGTPAGATEPPAGGAARPDPAPKSDAKKGTPSKPTPDGAGGIQ